MNKRPQQNEHEGRILNLQEWKGRKDTRASSSPVPDLKRYENDDQNDDYRERMIINVVALVFVVGLIGAGLWIAETMAEMRKNQDCVLSGRRGCTSVEVQHQRW
ncbi:MAG TPA: hypothetical protein VFS63_10685 [Pseudolabrys sp.]|jgi:hypothetical protein|nr:hypothetical protein [Pseudolabrys sp.]